jgi:hypothetical protein
MWIVYCEDGVSRHTRPFDEYEAAQQWADQGHACDGAHDIEEVVPRVRSTTKRR